MPLLRVRSDRPRRIADIRLGVGIAASQLKLDRAAIKVVAVADADDVWSVVADIPDDQVEGLRSALEEMFGSATVKG